MRKCYSICTSQHWSIDLISTDAVFFTDSEYEYLFGNEIARITHLLDETARIMCASCKGVCCRQIECQLYSEKFSICPIYEIRPRECRYHFCNQILDKAILSYEDKELLMKPINELLRSEKGHVSRLFTRFPRFPLDSEGLSLLGIQKEVRSIIRAFEDGMIEEKHARALLKSLCLESSLQQNV